MSVYNGAPHLGQALDSILSQQDVSLEFIIVDDGSTDESPSLLEQRAARDSRVVILRQPNAGLTRALIRGCEEARGVYIARQDADDISAPDRLRMQMALLEGDPSLALVGCWTKFVGPQEEDLGDWVASTDPVEATQTLRCGDPKRLRSLGGHGSAMFRRADYRRVGGYRPELYFAQDLDLWLRLTEVGMLGFVPKVLYMARTSPLSISGRFRQLQVATTRLVLELVRQREGAGDESAILRKAALIRPDRTGQAARSRDSGPGLYFLGKRLLDKRDSRAIGYLKGSIEARPWHVRSYLFLLMALLLTRGQGVRS